MKTDLDTPQSPEGSVQSRVRLPNDVARCNGSGSDAEGWREGCDTCLRRVAQRGERVVMIAAPPIIVFECEYLIEDVHETDFANKPNKALSESPENEPQR